MPLEIYSNLFERRRWLVTLFVIFMTSMAIWGHWRGPISPWKSLKRSERLLDRGADEADSQVLTDESVEPRDPPSIDALLVVEGDDFFTPDSMAALRAMVDAVEGLKAVESVIWIDRVPLMNMFGVPQPLIAPDGSSAERFREAKQAVLDHPLARGQLISEGGSTLLMPVEFDWLQVTSDDDCTTSLLHVARQSLTDSNVDSIGVRLTGDVPLFVAQHEALERNHLKFQIIGYGLALVVTVALFRGVSAVVIVSSAPAAGIFWSIGILNLLGHSTNTLTNVILPVLISMVGLTDGVHLMMHVRACRADGMSQLAAAREAIHRVGTACALTSLTTAIGFGSLLLAHSQFIRSFGEACAIGVIISCLAVITLIPLLCTTRLGRNLHRAHSRDLISRQLMGSIGMIEWVLRHRKTVSLLGIALTIALTGVSLTLRPDNQTKSSLPSGSEMFDALVHCDDTMGGIEAAQVVITWPESMQSDDPRIFHVVQEVQNILKGEPLLRHSLSIADLLATFPIEQHDLSTRMSFLDLLPPQLKDVFFDESVRETFVSVRIQDVGIAKYEPVFRDVESRFQQIAAEYDGFEIELSGDPVRRGRDLYRIVMDLTASLGAASIVIFLVLTIVYRSLRIGLISIIPNMFPLAVTASVLVLIDGSLHFASVCSFTVCLGIAVDDTIHFLTRYHQERGAGRNEYDAIRNTYLGIGTALVTTTVILVLGFGTAMTSDLPDHRVFAGMACATITAALVGDLFFLPAMLAWFPGRSHSDPRQSDHVSDPKSVTRPTSSSAT